MHVPCLSVTRTLHKTPPSLSSSGISAREEGGEHVAVDALLCSWHQLSMLQRWHLSVRVIETMAANICCTLLAAHGGTLVIPFET